MKKPTFIIGKTNYTFMSNINACSSSIHKLCFGSGCRFEEYERLPQLKVYLNPIHMKRKHMVIHSLSIMTMQAMIICSGKTRENDK